MSRQSIPQWMRDEVLARDGYACRYCGSMDGPFHMDHVYPVSKGGETSVNNLVTSCPLCNVKKHNKVGVWPWPVFVEEKVSIASVENVNNPKKKTHFVLIVKIVLITISSFISASPPLIQGIPSVYQMIGNIVFIAIMIPEVVIVIRSVHQDMKVRH